MNVATFRAWGVRVLHHAPREKTASSDEASTSEEEQPAPTLDANRLEDLRAALNLLGITQVPGLKTDCEPLAAILDGAIPSPADYSLIHGYLKMRCFSMKERVAVLACIQRCHPEFVSGMDLTAIYAENEQAELCQFLREAASQVLVFDVIVNSRTPEFIRNEVTAVLSNPECRVRKFSWRDASFPEPALLPSLANALSRCASIETVCCPSTWLCAIGDKVRKLEIWGWIDRPDALTALLRQGRIESVECFQDTCRLMVKAVLDAEKEGASHVHAVTIRSSSTGMPLPEALRVMELLRQSTLVTDLSLPSTEWVDERMLDWIAKGPIQVLDFDFVHDRDFRDHLDWLLQRKQAVALAGTKAATNALGYLLFKGPPADGFVARMTEWFAGTPDGPALTSVCKKHAYVPYVAARCKVHAQFDEKLRQHWIRKVQRANTRAARNLTDDYTRLLGVRCLTRDDIDVLANDLCKRIDCYFKEVSYPNDPEWDILDTVPEPPLFPGLAQDEDEPRKAAFRRVVKENADRASFWSLDFQMLTDGKPLTPDDIVALKQDFFDSVDRNFKRTLYPLALEPELATGVSGGEDEATSDLPHGKRTLTDEAASVRDRKKLRTNPANPG